MTAATAIPVTDWLLDLPLYTPVDIKERVSPSVKAILTYTGIVDFYCPACQLHTPFQGLLSLETQNSMASELMAAKAFGFASSFWLQTRFSKELACTRAGHKVIFHFQVEEQQLLKVGQYPSIAAIHYGELLHYADALGEQGLHDLHHADALSANSNSLGAYIYLRKLFETQLQMAYVQAQARPGWQAPGYADASIAAKVALLAQHLPAYLVQHPALYALLDLPVTELTEATCHRHYEALKTAVLLMADATLATNTRVLRESEAEQALSTLE